MFKLIIFDMDGTLIDSDEIIHKTWCELASLYKEKGFSFSREDTRRFSGPPLDDSLRKVFPDLDLDFIRSEYKSRSKKYYDSDLVFFDDEIEVLNRLHDDGIILAVDTNKQREQTVDSLEKGEIDGLFEIIIGSNNVSKLKPYPEGIDLILNETGISKEETLFVGDTDFDIQTAKNANIKCAIMRFKKRDISLKDNVDYWLDSYRELYRLVTNK